MARTPPAPGTVPGPPAGPTIERSLRDGTRVRIRPVRPSDRPRVAAFVARVSADSRERRFFSAVTEESVAAEIVAPHAPASGVSLLLEIAERPDGPVIAHGEFDRDRSDPARAEVAFLVADLWQGHGAATLLLRRLAEIARERGVRRFEAVVLSENQPMIDVFVGAGFPCSVTWRAGEGLVELDISVDPSDTGAVAAGPGLPLAR